MQVTKACMGFNKFKTNTTTAEKKQKNPDLFCQGSKDKDTVLLMQYYAVKKYCAIFIF